MQVIPHITDEIKRRIQILGETGDYDIVITEIGGTVGDIESLPYVESVRQLLWEKGSRKRHCYSLNIGSVFSCRRRIKDQTYPTLCKDVDAKWSKSRYFSV